MPKEDLFFLIFFSSVYKYLYDLGQFRDHSIYLVLSDKGPGGFDASQRPIYFRGVKMFTHTVKCGIRKSSEEAV